MKTFTVLGQKIMAHDKECVKGYREDKKLGLVYGSFKQANGEVISWEAASRSLNFCAYCGMKLKWFEDQLIESVREV